jgi:hypothetical protein
MTGNINIANLETYGKSWSETSHERRLMMYAICLDPACVYTDPNVQIRGYEALSSYMAELQNNVPDVAFVATRVQQHHDRCLMHWNMTSGGKVISDGASYFLFGQDGRLVQMNGFYDT